MSSESGTRNVVLVHGGFIDGSGWQAVHDLLTKEATALPSCRTRPCHWKTTPPSRGGPSTTWTARSSWSATPTAGQ